MRTIKLSEAARLLGHTPKTARIWAREGKLGKVEGKPARVTVAAVLKIAGPRSAKDIADALTARRVS